MTLSFQRQGILPLLFTNVARQCPRISSSTKTFLSSSKLLISAPSRPQEDDGQMPEALSVLKDAYKFRINQLRLERVVGKQGFLKPLEQECIREFEVVNVLQNNQKLLFMRLHHAKKVEKYNMSTFSYSPEFEGSGEGPCLVELKLERNIALKTVAARIYSPTERPIAYVYNLDGFRRTAIIENGTAIKCLFQILTTSPSCWSTDGKICNGKGRGRLGHFVKLKTDPDFFDSKRQIKLYVRLHQELDVRSKCILLGTALFLMSYDNVC